MIDDVSAEEQGPLEERIAARAERRSVFDRSLVGAASFAVDREGWGERVSERGSVRALRFETLQREKAGGLATSRPIRYFSGPWEGEQGELLPVSWFLLWRSNVDWVPDPALFERESDRRELVARRPRPEMVPPHRRVRPADMDFKPARRRLRPQDIPALRPIQLKKE
ncbi:MAG: hypothetical protein CMP23_02050 [Rickettsiales bacterium]|nr:hypothetical protein [Rickettsiales bacterium]